MQGVRHERAACGVRHGFLACLTRPQCRRGAALGLAGIVKGLGISAINGYGILDALKAAMDDQGNAGAREAALLALECLCASLGRRALGACIVSPQPRADAPACRPCAMRAWSCSPCERGTCRPDARSDALLGARGACSGRAGRLRGGAGCSSPTWCRS
jgi:hypothetical protein